MKMMGIDVGSTTVKVVVADERKQVEYSDYQRHGAEQAATLQRMLEQVAGRYGDEPLAVTLCGSGGKPVAEALHTLFVQEVVANAAAVSLRHPDVRTAVELGGQDAKVVFFTEGAANDMRMNGSCAGGTGAFIDEIASLLGTDADGLECLAAEGRTVYDISGRCGVFAKTDIQPLLLQGAKKEDIALSSLHAVAKQTIGGLSQGLQLSPPIIFEGGPLHFCPTLVRVFAERLHLTPQQIVLPGHSETFVAFGAAVAGERFKGQAVLSAGTMLSRLAGLTGRGIHTATTAPMFASEEEKAAFLTRHRPELHCPEHPARNIRASVLPVWIGIDCGSTTSKVALLDGNLNMVGSRYAGNHGDPLGVVRDQLNDLYCSFRRNGVELQPLGLGTTGYGAAMTARAFHADFSTVETIAHAEACRHYIPDTDFILDIGGQDMKAIWLRDGTVTDILVNEACSSGCGSFLENFSHSLGIPVEEIADHAFASRNPARLGSRCTVFMNSTIINEQRNGRNPDDLMAGLCRSIIENVFTKVVRVGNTDTLGRRVVVQGGTFKNMAVVRAIEEYLGRDVTIAPYPGLMGAIGIALLTAKKGELR